MQQTKGLAAGGIDRPRPPTPTGRSVLTFESDAGERGLQEPRVPITGLYDDRHCHAAKHGELMDDRPGWGGLRGLGLGRHAWSGCNAGAMGQTAVLHGFRRITSHPRRNWMQDAWKQMLVTVSGGAERKAAWTATTLDLETIAQRPLAGRAARLTNLLVVAPAGAGRLFLGVASATVPDTFPERHAVSFCRAGAISASAGARHVPVSATRSTGRFRGRGRDRREVWCRVLPPVVVRVRA